MYGGCLLRPLYPLLLSVMLDREFWVGTEKHSLERGEGPVGSEGEVRKNANSRNSLLTTAASTQISNNIKQQKKNRHKQTKQPEQAFMCAWGWRIDQY